MDSVLAYANYLRPHFPPKTTCLSFALSLIPFHAFLSPSVNFLGPVTRAGESESKSRGRGIFGASGVGVGVGKNWPKM